ncbi:MAG: SIR2 family protein [Acidimicrobiia bacterium]|nr:SIR2 family protein [Acidimicrobiia bacterium]
MASDKHRDNVRRVVKDVVDLFGANFSLTMEEYFTQLESMIRMGSLAGGVGSDLSPEELRAKRDRLMAGLAAVLEASTDVSRVAAPCCDLHTRIIERLQPRDTIISFNYDCVMDHALRRTASGKWSAMHGYGFHKPSRVVGSENWNPEVPAAGFNRTVNLLKLHGSLNWQLPPKKQSADGKIVLKQRLYQQRGAPRFTIIPPENVKDFDGDENFRHLWRLAERAIRGAEVICLAGFSFTPTDLHVESLFRIALARGNLKQLLIANPSRDDRARIRSVFSRPLQSGCMVRQFDDLADLARYLEHHDLSDAEAT